MTQDSDVLEGVFEVEGNAGGHLRSRKAHYRPRGNDPQLSKDLTKRFFLRGGEIIRAQPAPAAKGKSKRLRVGEVLTINGMDPQEYTETKPLQELTAIDPAEPIRFETEGGPTSMRIIDLVTPIGRGQRGLIVAPPRTGKTILMQQMAAGVAANYPDMHIMVLLVDERPEEVTDMSRNIVGEVIASSNDHDVASHVRTARMVINKAKRMVECGQDVFMLMDSLTRLGRAFNNFSRGTGRIMSGGLDSRALEEPKTIFGAARNIEHGGSLTIIATALIDTGSRMDEVIFNEFKGTGNMELELCRELADRRIWPAINLEASGTRKEELLLSPEMLAASHHIRRDLGGRSPQMFMEALLKKLVSCPTNKDFAKAVAR